MFKPKCLGRTLFVLVNNDLHAVDVATSTQQHVGGTPVRLSNSR